MGRRIASLKAYHCAYQFPRRDYLAWTGGVIKGRDCVFVKVTDTDGRVGWGEISEVYFWPEAYVDLINRKVAGFLKGAPVGQREGLQRRLQVFLISLGTAGLSRAVVSGIDLALWNLVRDEPRRTARVPVYASTGFSRDRGEMLAECARAVAAGFRYVKIRGGTSPGEDVRRAKASRALLGDRTGLILDLAQPYTQTPYTFAEVVRICRGIQECNLLWVEEPFWPDDEAAYARLHKTVAVKIGCGENLHTEEQFCRFGPVVDVLQPDVARMGGITTLVRIARHDRQICPHQFGTSVALYTLVRRLHHVRNVRLVELDLLANPFRNAIFGKALRIVNGELIVERCDMSGFEIEMKARRRWQERKNRIGRV